MIESAASPPCPACGAHPLGLLCDPERMRELGRRAQAFHAARLRSRRREELEERASFTQEDEASLLACDGCGLLLRWPRPSPDEMVRTYTEDQVPEDRLAEMIASQISLYRRQVPVLRRLLGAEAPRVVEVGSFVGGFLEVARTAGWEALGVDPNRQLAESCRARGLDVIEATLEEVAVPEAAGSADAVVIWNTFDQLADPKPVLAASARLVRASGILALRVPHGVAFRALHALLDRAHGARRRFLEACLAWNNLLSFPYLHGYGIASLERIVPGYGFRRVRVRGDVLGVLSGRATRGFARAEERGVKRLQTGWIALQARDPQSALPAAPWLDLYYRRTGDRAGGAQNESRTVAS
jgi:SAM-dependent methyltransferase